MYGVMRVFTKLFGLIKMTSPKKLADAFLFTFYSRSGNDNPNLLWYMAKVLELKAQGFVFLMGLQKPWFSGTSYFFPLSRFKKYKRLKWPEAFNLGFHNLVLKRSTHQNLIFRFGVDLHGRKQCSFD